MGSEVDVQCIVRRSGGEIVLYNAVDAAIYSHDGTSTTLLRDSTEIKSDIGASDAMDRCDGVDIDGNGNVYLLLRATEMDGSNASNSETQNIYKLPPSGSGSPSVLATADGLSGIAVTGGTVYLTGVAFNNASEDGFYSISTAGTGQSLNTVATDAELDLSVLEADGDGDLYSFSGGFADVSSKENVLVQLSDPAGSPSISVWADPYAGPFVNPGDGGIKDIEAVSRSGADRYYIYNESFSASDGEQFGVYQEGGTSPSIFANETDISNAIGNTITGAFTAPMLADASGEIFFAARDRSSDPDQLLRFSNVPLPVEMARFDAVTNGASVTLSWKTASETNNAGFRVQRATEDGWTSLGFVDSKATGGTTTEAQSYRFNVEQELGPGTHRFRLKQTDLDGTTHLSDVVSVDVQMSKALSLSAPAPNPVVQQAAISFAVKENAEATVSLYNTLGQKVSTLYQGTPPVGQAKDLTLSTDGLPSGVYLVRLQADGQSRTQRVTVVK